MLNVPIASANRHLTDDKICRRRKSVIPKAIGEMSKGAITQSYTKETQVSQRTIPYDW